MRILVLNGPNLNLLGQREPTVYGTQTLEELEAAVTAYASTHKAELQCLQHNHEGALIDLVQTARFDYDGIVFNPGAYAHYSYALRDAIAAIAPLPVVEVHLTDISTREDFRRLSVTAPVCAACFSGGGQQSYFDAIDFLIAGGIA
jgi:3-dehydroquinate dehydratase-2